MTDRGRGYEQFFAELKRRKVFRVMAVYGIVGFLVIQIVDLAVPALLLPAWSYRLVAFLLLVGFPIAVVLAWAFETTPEGVRRTEEATNEEMAALLAQPASRRWSAGFLALAGAALLFGGWWMGRAGGPVAEPDARMVDAGTDDVRTTVQRIAVLPFANVRGDDDSEVLAVGLQEGVAQKLRGLDALRVTSTGSVQEYRTSDKNDTQIAGELGTGYLVRGTVLRAGEHVQVNVSLIDGESGETLWGDSFDQAITAANLFAIQSGIAVDVVREVGSRLSPADIAALNAGPPSNDLAALNAYNRARQAHASSGFTISHHQAIRWAQRAVELDSGFVAAWGLLVRLVAQQARTGDADTAIARHALERVERLAPGSVEAITARAFFSYYAENRFAEALEQLQQAERLVPSDGGVTFGIANLHRRLRHVDEAISAFKRTIALDPRNQSALLTYSQTLAAIGRLEAADAVADRALEVAPSHAAARAWKTRLAFLRSGNADQARRLAIELGLDPGEIEAMSRLVALAVMAGELEEASQLADRVATQTAEWDEFRRLWSRAWPRLLKGETAPAIGDSLRGLFEGAGAPGLPELADALGHAAAGDEAAAVKTIDEALRVKAASDDYWSGLTFSGYSITIRSLFGRVEEALDLLEQSVAGPSRFGATELAMDPTFDRLRADPRFDALVAKRKAYEADQARAAEADRPWLP